MRERRGCCAQRTSSSLPLRNPYVPTFLPDCVGSEAKCANLQQQQYAEGIQHTGCWFIPEMYATAIQSCDVYTANRRFWLKIVTARHYRYLNYRKAGDTTLSPPFKENRQSSTATSTSLCCVTCARKIKNGPSPLHKLYTRPHRQRGVPGIKQ